MLPDAADWTSAAFASYLNLAKIETAAVHLAADAVPPVDVGGSDDDSDSESASSD